MPNNTCISVILPVYNAKAYVAAAIESILNQTYKNYELLLIDDASTDTSLSIMLQYTDPRIKLIRNEQNLGLIKTLNKALSIAKGMYLARMDADDISLPKRFETQVQFMEQHQDIGICGTWVKTYGDGKKQIVQLPSSHEDIVATMLFECPFMHPTVMMRRKILEHHNLFYNEHAPHAEDYELWARAAQYTKFANIPEVLLHLRHHTTQISKTHAPEQNTTANSVRTTLLKTLIPDVTPEELSLHLAISRWQFTSNKRFVLQAKAWLEKLAKHTQRNIVAKRWFYVCNNTKLSVWNIKQFYGSHLARDAQLSFFERGKFLGKSFFRY